MKPSHNKLRILEKKIKKQMKSEALKKIEEEEAAAISKWDCGSPLFDSYKLVSPNHLIESHLMAFPSLGASKPIIKMNFIHPSHHDHMVSVLIVKNGFQRE